MSFSASKIALVAEDDILVRMDAAETLAGAGFEVIQAATAAAALTLLHLKLGGIALLFTDIHMPPGEMDGLALAHHVRSTWPHIGLLITSGDARPLPHSLPEGSVFLAKPYDPENVTLHALALAPLRRED